MLFVFSSLAGAVGKGLAKATVTVLPCRCGLNKSLSPYARMSITDKARESIISANKQVNEWSPLSSSALTYRSPPMINLMTNRKQDSRPVQRAFPKILYIYLEKQKAG